MKTNSKLKLVKTATRAYSTNIKGSKEPKKQLKTEILPKT